MQSATLNANLPEHACSGVPVPCDCIWAVADCSCGLQLPTAGADCRCRLQLRTAAAQHRNCAVSAACTKRKAAMHTRSPALLHANRGCSGTPAADSKVCSRISWGSFCNARHGIHEHQSIRWHVDVQGCHVGHCKGSLVTLCCQSCCPWKPCCENGCSASCAVYSLKKAL